VPVRAVDVPVVVRGLVRGVVIVLGGRMGMDVGLRV
jgi:hypothetical protein